MISRRSRRPEALVLGTLNAGAAKDLGHSVGLTLVPTTMERLGAVGQRHSLLLVADPPTAEQRSVLADLRDVNPALVVLELSGPGQAAGAAESLVDGRFAWPADRALLIAELEARSRPEERPGLLWPVLILIAGVGIVLLLWHLVTVTRLSPPYILPGPAAVWAAFAERPENFLFHSGVTALEALIGFMLGNALGFLTALLLHRVERLRPVSLAGLTGLQAIPIMALAPLLVVWFGTGAAAKVLMAAIVCYFPVVSNTLGAFSSVDRDLVSLFRFHRANYWDTLTRLLLPASIPALAAGLRISGGLAVVGAIVAEFTGADRGLGYLLLNLTYRLETAGLFVAIICSAVLGIAFANLPGLILSATYTTHRKRRLR
ncbi:MAG TPA: ABC transporter permease [Allosphingosinicella sp.]|nr:ABC transporter permease [Allosphingosinicella sp.]